MRAHVTVIADVNTLALSRMLAEGGDWLVTVHNRRIVKLVRIPKSQPVEKIVAEGNHRPGNHG